MDNNQKGKNSVPAIKLPDLMKRGIYMEEACNFESSVYADVYKNAMYSVEKIVEENRELMNEQRRGVSRPVVQVSNVVSFVGRRGTGKTSSMMSFRNAMAHYRDYSCYNREAGRLCFHEDKYMDQVQFYVLNYIDASVLEESENVFILVLANMLEYIQKMMKDRREETRELIRDFESIYRDYLSLRDSRQCASSEYSAYELLMGVAGSQKVRQRFSKLVQDFLQCMNSKGQEGYIVVTIDDLDMAYYNIQRNDKKFVNNKSYEIVNTIHKYLSVPGIILLTTYNYTNLLSQCSNFFYISDSSNSVVHDDSLDVQRSKSAKLANQFEEKAFALRYRVYMPSWKKSDFKGDSLRIDVNLEQENINSIFDNQQDILSMKKFILQLYAYKLGIYYDCFGTKIHFLEPDSVRQLLEIVSLFDLASCRAWEKYPKEEEEKCKHQIFKRIKSDVYFRFIEERLYLPEERNFFNDLMEKRIDKRSQEIVKKYCSRIEKLGRNSIETMERAIGAQQAGGYQVGDSGITEMVQAKEQLLDNSHVTYSLAELIHVIYHMTREDHMATRDMVDCILHSYTIHLSELYYKYRRVEKKVLANGADGYYKESDSDTIEYKKRFVYYEEILSGIIGQTIFGRWSEYLLPKVNGKLFTKVANKPEIRDVMIAYVDQASIDYEVELPQSVSREELRTALKEVIFVLFMYNDITTCEAIKIDVQETEKNMLVHIYTEKKHNFEPTAIFKNVILFRQVLNRIEKLYNDRCKENAENNFFSDHIRGTISDEFKKIKSEFVDWAVKYGAMILPIHDFDLFYNLIKHMYLEKREMNETKILERRDDVIDIIDDMKEYFESVFQSVENYYGKENLQWVEKLNKCPIFQWLEDLRRNEYSSLYAFVTNIVTQIQFGGMKVAEPQSQI